MSRCNPKSKDDRAIRCIQSWIAFLVLATLLTGCLKFARETENGIVFITSRGNDPIAQSISWSPLDENKVLIRAYETPLQPAELYVLDIQTKEKEYVAGPIKPAEFIETKWMPDGKRALILAVDTKGFEPSGWWAINIDNKSAEYLLSPMDTVTWSPDGKFIAALQRTPGNNSSSIELKLIDADTKAEQTVASYPHMDYSSGISWSPDSQFVVFALGEYQDSNSLFILNVGTRKVSTISENNKAEQPSWSPRGNIIAFENKNRLYLINSDGQCETEIPNLENAWSPTWSPDGMKLGYISGDGIYYVDLEKILGRDISEGLCE